MREIQALDPTVDPDQAIRTPCAPAAPAVPKAPAAPATPAAAQALKLTDAAARLGEALCGVPTERNPSTPHTRGCTPGWYAVPRWGTHLNRRQPYLAQLRQPQWIVTGLVLAWWGNPHSELPQRGNAYQPRVQPWVRSLINQMRSEGTLHITR